MGMSDSTCKHSTLQPPNTTNRLYRYRINRGLLLGTLVFAVLLGGGSFYLRKYQVARNAAVLLDRARRLASEKPEDAIRFYAQFLQLTATDRRDEPAEHARAEIVMEQARLLRAQTGEAINVPRIIRAGEEALRLNPKLDEARQLLIPLLMATREYTSALTHLEILEKSAKDPRELAELAFRAGRCQEMLDRFDQAASSYRQSIASLPAQFPAHIGLARIAANQPRSLRSESVSTIAAADASTPLATLLASVDSRAAPPSLAALAIILNDMVAANAKHASEANALRAYTLTTTDVQPQILPVPGDPDASARRALADADVNKDSVLKGSERFRAQVPAFADRDHDGTVTADELTARFQEGDDAARQRIAEDTLRELLAKDGTSSRGTNELLLAVVGNRLAMNATGYLDSSETRKSRLEESRAWVDRAVEAHENDLRLRLLQADLILREPVTSNDERLRNLAKAEQTIRSAEELPTTQLAINDFDEWLTTWPPMNRALLNVQMKFSLASILLARATLSPDQREELLAETSGLLGELRKSNAAPELPLLIELQVAQLRGNRRDILALAKKLEISTGKPGELPRDIAGRVAQVYLALGDTGAALEVYRRQVRAEPLWAAGRIGLGELLEQLGRSDEAITQLQPVAGVPGVSERLALLLLFQQSRQPPDRRDFRRARAAFEQARAIGGDPIRLSVLEAELASQEASTYFALSQSLNRPELRSRAEELLDTAESSLRTAIESNPSSVSLRAALASHLLRREDKAISDRLAEVSAILNSADTELGKHGELAVVGLEMARRQSPGKLTESLDRVIAELDQFPTSERAGLVTALVNAKWETGDHATARRLAVAESVARPDELSSQSLAVLALLNDFQPGDANWQAEWGELLKRLEQLEGTTDGAVAMAQAQRRIAAADKTPDAEKTRLLTEARTFLQTARKSRPYVALIARTLGAVEESLKNYPAAADNYEAAMLLGDRTATLIQRLAAVLVAQKKVAEANRLMARVAAEQPQVLTGDLARLAWQLAWNQKQYDEALKLVSRLATDSNLPDDRLAEALMRYARGDVGDDVLQALTQAAHELAPDRAEAWMALTLYQLRNIDLATAQSTVVDAEARLLATPSAKNLVNVARLWEALTVLPSPDQVRFLSEARRRLEQAVQEHPEELDTSVAAIDFYIRHGDTDKAEVLVAGLLDPKKAVPTTLRAFAERARALLGAKSGTYADTTAALASLKGSVDSPEQQIANHKLRLLLLRRVQDADTRREQVKIFEALKGLEPLSIENHLQYAILLDQVDEPTKARAEFQELLRTQPNNLNIRIAAVESFLRRAARDPGAIALARDTAETLFAREPDSLRAAVLHGKLLAAEDRMDEAANRLAAYVTQRTALTGEDLLKEALSRENTNDLLVGLLKRLPADKQLVASRVFSNAAKKGQEDLAERLAPVLNSEPYLEPFQQIMLESHLQAANLIESWNAEVGEQTYAAIAATTKSQLAVIELVRSLCRHQNWTSAIAAVNTYWKELQPRGVAYLMSVISQSKPVPWPAEIDQWVPKLVAEAEPMTGADRAYVFLLLGNFANEREDSAAAMTYYEKSFASDERSPIAMNNFAFIAARQGQRLPEAEKAIDEAIRQTGSRPELLDTKAAVLIAQDRAAEARDLLRTVPVQQLDSTLLFRLAECQHRLGNKSEATAMLNLAVEKGLTPDKIHPLDREVFRELRQLSVQ